MTDDSAQTTCDKCGQEYASAELTVDEETAMRLCPVCALDQESCACSDGEG